MLFKSQHYSLTELTLKKGCKAMKLLCMIGIHFYEHQFISYGDYGLCSVEDDLCVMEGYHTFICKYCPKEDSERFKKIFSK